MQELNLQPAVIFAGFVRDIESVYQALDVFVFPALFEGLGTSLLGAMAHGVPSVTYFGCALGEIVQSGINGLQVQSQNTEVLAADLRDILGNPSLAARMSAAGRDRIEAVFSAEKMVEATIRLLVADHKVPRSQLHFDSFF